MPCRVCVQLEEALAKTRTADSPELLLGLTDAGMRNHTHQKRERAVKAETDLSKHKRACSKRDSEVIQPNDHKPNAPIIAGDSAEGRISHVRQVGILDKWPRVPSRSFIDSKELGPVILRSPMAYNYLCLVCPACQTEVPFSETPVSDRSHLLPLWDSAILSCRKCQTETTFVNTDAKKLPFNIPFERTWLKAARDWIKFISN